MFEWLWLIPALPLAGFAALALAGRRLGRRLGRRAPAVIGAGTAGAAAALCAMIAVRFFESPPPGRAFAETLWTWISVEGFAPRIELYLDPLSLVMALVVTFVGFLILLYSAEFMEEEEGYSRFFAYMDLFVASMLILVLAKNLLLLYLGWEGVGLCSYLLIGFWYQDSANGRAARKGFIVTRVGDTAMAIGLFLLFTRLGTLDIPSLLREAPSEWKTGSGVAAAAAALLLGGALGKSAQLPLQTWLPDAMAGPSPVSALIHAATMVTAGVYLIARMRPLFALAPAVQAAVAVIGAATLLYGGCAALAQSNIKRVLAYSTISQIGYMFLALGAGAPSAAIFHFMTHAFFKSLLFLAAGAVILALRDEHNMFRMGGLRREMPLTFWTFLIGSCSLCGLPIVTAGFYSKEMILSAAFESPWAAPWLCAAGMLGVLLTAAYTFRMVFLTFFGPARGGRPGRGAGWRMSVPLTALAALSAAGGCVELPHWLGGAPLFSDFLQSVFAERPAAAPAQTEALLPILAALLLLLGLWLAYVFRLAMPGWSARLVKTRAGGALHRFCLAGLGFDALYDRLFVRPFVRAAQINRRDFTDAVFTGTAEANLRLHRALSRTQTGVLRWYAMGIALGAITTILIAVLV
jgi:NADH-quinone oxidoreductase subunit L